MDRLMLKYLNKTVSSRSINNERKSYAWSSVSALSRNSKNAKTKWIVFSGWKAFAANTLVVISSFCVAKIGVLTYTICFMKCEQTFNPPCMYSVYYLVASCGMVTDCNQLNIPRKALSTFLDPVFGLSILGYWRNSIILYYIILYHSKTLKQHYVEIGILCNSVPLTTTLSEIQTPGL